MSHFAKILEGKVINLIVAEQDFISSGAVGDSLQWVEYKKDGSIRANPAVMGGVYDSENDVFYTARPFASWTLNETTWKWEAPVSKPTDGQHYKWDEDTTSWVAEA